ncbi:hypothetical protein GCM10010919_03780 [Alishewanella longhuensis]|uniref:Solute-binding protein family 3/N-terminal domain-containing protein n=2 Tax=Alishewanella longhuensis TaxID=1091037 RepID=A0ABQ3KTK0_9ALTE|nr:hypothetical protein GCM10010919_03780 [Alishewanella longhuensis]
MQYVSLIMRLALLLGMLYLSSAFAAANKTSANSPEFSIKSIHIATDIWPGFTEPNEQGAYIDLIKLLFPTGIDFEITYTSFNRTVKMVEEQQADIVLGISFNESSRLYLSARPFDVDQIAVLFKPGRFKFEKSEDFKNYQLVMQRGYNYDIALGISTPSYEVDNIITGVDLVRAGRVDAFLVEKTELEGKLNANELADMELVFIAGEPIFIGFAKNERGAILKAWWDQQFQLYSQNGKLLLWYQQHPGMTLP